MAKTVKELAAIVAQHCYEIDTLTNERMTMSAEIETQKEEIAQLQQNVRDLASCYAALKAQVERIPEEGKEFVQAVETLIEQAIEVSKTQKPQPQVQQQRRTVEEGGWAPRLGRPGTEHECKRCEFVVRVNEYGACPECYTVAAEARKQYRNRQAA